MTGDTSDAEGGRESRHRRDFSRAVISPFESVCIGWTGEISLVVPFKWKPLSGRQLEGKLSVGRSMIGCGCAGPYGGGEGVMWEQSDLV